VETTWDVVEVFVRKIMGLFETDTRRGNNSTKYAKLICKLY